MKKILMMFIIVFSLLFLPFIWAQEEFEKVPDDEWPSQVIFDTIQVCYQGTLRWIAMGNPLLLSQPPPYQISRKMTIHCFCVLDKIRTKYKYKAYVDYITQDDKVAPKIVPQLFMGKSLECIKDHQTLEGLILLDNESLKKLDEYVEDNETQVDKKVEEKSSNSGKSDSPEQPKEFITDPPLLNF